MFGTIIVGIVSGVISSLIASFLFLKHVKRIVPDIKLSHDIITDTDPETGRHSLAIKFINKSPNSLVGVTVTLFGDNYQNTEKTVVNYRQLSKKEIPFVHCYNNSDENCRYAIIATMPIDKTLTDIQNEFHALSVKVIGMDALYGTYASISQCYESANIKDHSFFETCQQVTSRKNNQH